MNAVKCEEVTGRCPLSHTHRSSFGKPVFSLLSTEGIKIYFSGENCARVEDLKNRMFSFSVITRNRTFSSYSWSRFLSCDVCKIVLLSKSIDRVPDLC